MARPRLNFRKTSPRSLGKLQMFSGRTVRRSCGSSGLTPHLHFVHQACPLRSNGLYSTIYSLPAGPSSRSRLHRQIESLKHDFLVPLATLRRHINCQASPIYRLHLELFPAVASHLESKLDLIRATHVSYRWRNALHAHPSLWAHLDFKNTGRALEFLKRSKSAPLHVQLLGGGRKPPSIEPLLPHATRIVTLGLVDRPDHMALLSHLMPSLRRLEITYDRYKKSSDDDEDNDDYNNGGGGDANPGLPHRPVEGAASWSLPSVISLVVYNIHPIPFHVPHPTCFKFRYVYPTNDTAVLGNLLDFLHECPLLEDLEISHLDGPLRANLRAVSLPNLLSYTQNAHSSRRVYSLGVFDALSLPLPCRVMLKSWTDSDAKSNVADIIPPFKNPSYLAGIRRVKLSMVPVRFRPSILGTLELINDQGTRVCLEREILTSAYPRKSDRDLLDDDPTLGLLDRLKDLDTRSVEILCIEVDSSWVGGVQTIDAVKEALGRLENIKTLVISRSAVKVCLLALERSTGTDKNDQGFPQLRTLVVHSRYPDKPYGLDTLRALLLVAQKRKAAGCPFESITAFLRDTPSLGGYLRKQEELEMLKGYVEKLKGCVEKFILVKGDDTLDWCLDECFLDGIGHRLDHREVK